MFHQPILETSYRSTGRISPQMRQQEDGVISQVCPTDRLRMEHCRTCNSSAKPGRCYRTEPSHYNKGIACSNSFRRHQNARVGLWRYNHTDKCTSQDDMLFIQKLEEIRQKQDGHIHYEVPLPFKNRPQLHNNKKLARIRLEHLKRKCDKD